MKTGLVQKLKPWSIFQRRIPLMAGLPIAFAVAACNQPAPPAAAPAHTAIERIEGGYTDVGPGRISTYAEMEAQGGPKAIGVSFSSSFLNALTGQPLRPASLRRPEQGRRRGPAG